MRNRQPQVLTRRYRSTRGAKTQLGPQSNPATEGGWMRSLEVAGRRTSGPPMALTSAGSDGLIEQSLRGHFTFGGEEERDGRFACFPAELAVGSD